jgi:integrase
MARGTKSNLIRWRAEGNGYYENFSVRGRRFRGSLGTDQREEAETRAASRYAAALAGEAQTAGAAVVAPRDQTLDHVLGVYWLEHGQFLPSAADITRISRTLKAGLGADRRVAELTIAELRRYAAQRRGFISNRSVNVELVHLRSVLNRAKKQGVPIPEIRWRDVLLEETGTREHVLSADDEEPRLFQALRADYHPMVRFALLSGMRLSNVLELTWRQIDREAGVIKLIVKGGKLHYVPITPLMGAILDRERGNNFERVFTYVCARNRHDPKTGLRQDKDTRYPFTHDGWRKEWQRALAEAGIEDFRFHDLRHTAATRTLRSSKNLMLVQKMLGHQDIATTLRYTKSDLDDVRAAMVAGQQAAQIVTEIVTDTPAQAKK